VQKALPLKKKYPVPEPANEGTRLDDVLVVIKIRHFLEPLYSKMLMQFTF
jgi:hypothetical protein